MSDLDIPFPYFGGKRKISSDVWDLLGDVTHYIEPFCGSAAVLLDRPDHHDIKSETINDADGYVTNAWRAIQNEPGKVSDIIQETPVDQLTMLAWNDKLIKDREDLTERLREDPDFWDVEIAGYWIWGQCIWLGSGWGYKSSEQIPHLASQGRGVMSLTRRDRIHTILRDLSDRLQHVRICCGDWSSVVPNSVMDYDSLKPAGVYLDPPYDMNTGREGGLYAEEMEATNEVEEWCLRWGQKSDVRIVLSGYSDEYQKLEDHGWKVRAWVADGGWKNQSKTEDNENRHKERFWISPGVPLPNEDKQLDHFSLGSSNDRGDQQEQEDDDEK